MRPSVIALWLALSYLPAEATLANSGDFRVHVVIRGLDEPIQHAVVRLASLQQVLTGMTDAHATVLFSQLPAGSYDIHVTARGFVIWDRKNQEITDVPDRVLDAALSLTSMTCGDSPEVDYDVLDSDGVAVKGTVLNADSRRGLRGAMLSFRRIDATGTRILIRSGKKGLFEVSNLPPGRYELRATYEFFREDKLEFLAPARNTALVRIPLDRADHLYMCQ